VLCNRSAAGLGLMLILATGAGSAAAGSVTATFTVSAQLRPLDSTAACRLDRTTGAVQCASGGQSGSAAPLQPVQLLSGYRVQDAALMAMPETEGFRSYSTILDAYSSIRLVNFGGLDYLEMTLSW